MTDEKLESKLSSPPMRITTEESGQENTNPGPSDSIQLLSPMLSPSMSNLAPLESSPLGSPTLAPKPTHPLVSFLRRPETNNNNNNNNTPKRSTNTTACCRKPLIIVSPCDPQSQPKVNSARTSKSMKPILGARSAADRKMIRSSAGGAYDDPGTDFVLQQSPPMSTPMNPTSINKSASPLIIDSAPLSGKLNDPKNSGHIRGSKYAGKGRRGVSMSPVPSKKEPLKDMLDRYQVHIFGRGISIPTSILLPAMFHIAIFSVVLIALVFIHEWHTNITDLVYAGRSTVETNSHLFRRELSGRAVSAVLNLMESAGTATEMVSHAFSEEYLANAYMMDDVQRFNDAFVPIYSAYDEFSTMAIITQHSGAEHMFVIQRLDESGGAATYGAIDGDRTADLNMYFYGSDFAPTGRLAAVNNTNFDAIPFWTHRNRLNGSMVWFMDRSSSALRSRSDVLVGFIQKIYRRDDQSLLAIVSTSFTARRISDILSTLPLTKNTRVFIIANNPPYKFLAGKNIEPAVYDPTNFSAFEHPSDIVRETVNAWAAANNIFGDNANNTNANNVNNDNDGSYIYDSNKSFESSEFFVCDGTIIVNTRRINYSYNMDLILFILIPKDDVVGPIMAQYTRFNRTYSSIIGCFVCVTVLACITSRYFGRKMSNKCKAIAKSLETIITLDESDMYTDTNDGSGSDDNNSNGGSKDLMDTKFLLNSNPSSNDDKTPSTNNSPDLNNERFSRKNNGNSGNTNDNPSANTLINSSDDVGFHNSTHCSRRRRRRRPSHYHPLKDQKGTGTAKEKSKRAQLSKAFSSLKDSASSKLRRLTQSFSTYFSSPHLPPAPGTEVPSKIIVQEINEVDKSVTRLSRMVKNFARYIPLPVVRMYMKNRQRPELKLVSKHAVIMFLDIANFTRLSEQLGDSMISALNKLFEEFSNILIEHGAVIDKYMGDAIMALWNVPEGIDAPEARAAKAAIRIIQRLDQLNAEYFPARYGCTMSLRIGMNCGDVYAGNVGVPQRMNYTVLGNNVNIAARLEPLNKELGTRILVTEAFRKACGASLLGADVLFRCLGATCLRGMKSPVVVHQVMGDGEFVPEVNVERLNGYRVLDVDRMVEEWSRGVRSKEDLKRIYEEYLSRNSDDKAVRYFCDHLI